MAIYNKLLYTISYDSFDVLTLIKPLSILHTSSSNMNEKLRIGQILKSAR